MKIAPSMLASDFANFGPETRRMEQGGADYIHLDIMDGLFVPNLSFGLAVVKAARPYAETPFDVHLMIQEPAKYVQRFAEAGADWISFHLEATGDPAHTAELIRACGVHPALAVKPATPVERVYPYLDLVDMVLIMTVEPGFGGQSFMADMMDKVRLLRGRLLAENKSVLIEIDGGVNEETIAQAAAAGVDICVAGTGVFKAADAGEAIRALKTVAAQYEGRAPRRKEG